MALFTHMTFIVLTGVMLSSFIVGIYEKKTIHLMFSYPISRRKILFPRWLLYGSLVFQRSLPAS